MPPNERGEKDSEDTVRSPAVSSAGSARPLPRRHDRFDRIAAGPIDGPGCGAARARANLPRDTPKPSAREWCTADPGSPQTVTVPGLQRTAGGPIAKSTKASAALRCARDTHLSAYGATSDQASRESPGRFGARSGLPDRRRWSVLVKDLAVDPRRSISESGQAAAVSGHIQGVWGRPRPREP